ncbi:hypothetical protein [Methylibium sp.]|uniref:hypothetical protein n=1 Tax=Methylibium sp. TaxID=2067992 RepID=UPI003D0F4E34
MAAPYDEIEADMWRWMREFVSVKNEFYGAKFPPCPFAQKALLTQTVDVAVWQSGDVRRFIRECALDMRDSPKLTTRVMAFPPRVQMAWGINDFVEALNREVIKDNVFLNTGVAKTSISKYPGSGGLPYFMVVANSLEPVLKGAEALQKTDYYKEWPAGHYEIVVERRERMAKRYGKHTEPDHL